MFIACLKEYTYICFSSFEIAKYCMFLDHLTQVIMQILLKHSIIFWGLEEFGSNITTVPSSVPTAILKTFYC